MWLFIKCPIYAMPRGDLGIAIGFCNPISRYDARFGCMTLLSHSIGLGNFDSGNFRRFSPWNDGRFGCMTLTRLGSGLATLFLGILRSLPLILPVIWLRNLPKGLDQFQQLHFSEFQPSAPDLTRHQVAQPHQAANQFGNLSPLEFSLFAPDSTSASVA